MNITIPAISVIIPIYNVENYLEECVYSVLRQEFQDFEIILIEDCSTDNSKEICNKIKDIDSRIKLIYHTENKGPSSARNTGIKEATGKYITFIDSDDWIEHNFLLNMYNIAEKTNADVVSGGYTEYVLNDSHYIPSRKIQLVNNIAMMVEDKTDRINAMLKFSWSDVAWGKLYKRALFTKNEILRFENILSEDELFHFLLTYLSDKYVFIPTTEYCYRQSPTSIMRGNGNKEKCKKALVSVLDCQKYVDEYIKIMNDIFVQNKQLSIVVKQWFANVFINNIYASSCRNLSAEDILSVASEVFEEKCNKESGVLLYMWQLLLHQFPR